MTRLQAAAEDYFLLGAWGVDSSVCCSSSMASSDGKRVDEQRCQHLKRRKTNTDLMMTWLAHLGIKYLWNLIMHRGVLFSLSLSASSNGLITLTHVDWGSITQVLLVVESTLPTESIAQ